MSESNAVSTEGLVMRQPRPIRTSSSRKHRKALREASTPRSSSPEGTRRIPPRIHNKLYCEQVNKVRRTPSTVLAKLNNDELKSVRSHTELAETANGVRMLAKNLAKATIQLDVKNIMVVTKARDNSLIHLTREIVEWFLTQEKGITVYVDSKIEFAKRFNAPDILKAVPEAKDHLRYWNKEFTITNPEKFDLVLTLGGDGTVLYVSNLFQRIVPPVISFALGSLGFLTNFRFEEFRSKMLNVLDSGVRANLRMRFTCRVHKSDGKLVCEQQVLNEVVVDRGPSPFVTNLELYGDGSLLTTAQADGLIIATPTGATAYSLSAGGSLVHPGVSAISVTPICPHALSFRPILLPDGMFLKVKVPMSSRAQAWASFDGKVRTELSQGDYVTVQASPFPFPTVISSKTEYIDSVSRNLHWNVRHQQKPFSHYKLNPQRNIEEEFNQLHIEEDEDDNFEIDYSDAELNGIDIGDEISPSVLSTSHQGSGNVSGVSLSSNSSEEDTHYLPSPGNGLSTPPSHTLSFANDDGRAYFAHPHAKISIGDSSSSQATM